MTLSQEQHEARSKGVGGSDVPIILGAVSYKTPVQLWLEKRGKSEPEDIGDKINVRMGNKLEPVVVELFEEEMQEVGDAKKCRKINQTKVHRDYPWMVGNIDRDIVGERAGFEAKAFSPFAREMWGESGTDEVPLAVTAQCAHYMEIFNYDAWYVGVLLGIHDFRWYRLERNQATIDKMIQIEGEFWQHVEQGTQPRILTGDDVAALHPRGIGQISCDSALREHEVLKLAEMKADKKMLEDQIEALTLNLKKYMEGAAELFPRGVELMPQEGIDPLITWNHSKDRIKTDWENAFKELVGLHESVIDPDELKEILRRYTTIQTPGPRSFLLKKKGVAELIAKQTPKTDEVH